MFNVLGDHNNNLQLFFGVKNYFSDYVKSKYGIH